MTWDELGTRVVEIRKRTGQSNSPEEQLLQAQAEREYRFQYDVWDNDAQEYVNRERIEKDLSDPRYTGKALETKTFGLAHNMRYEPDSRGYRCCVCHQFVSDKTIQLAGSGDALDTLAPCRSNMPTRETGEVVRLDFDYQVLRDAIVHGAGRHGAGFARWGESVNPDQRTRDEGKEKGG